MHGARGALGALMVVALAMAAPLARPAVASHEQDLLSVTVAINAAGGDRISVTDDTYGSTGFRELASEVALALDRPSGSFRAVEGLSGGHVELDERLATPDGRGGLSWSLDTGELQLLAQEDGYEAVLVKVCTPRVRQSVDVLRAPQRLPVSSPGSRCGGWYQPVEEPPIRAVVQLDPDRGRYPWAVGRIAGAAAIAFGLLGIGATLLRRDAMSRRSLGSWLLSIGAAVGIAPLGWGVATVVLWWRGIAADPVMLGGGSVGEQVARTMVPGLAFLLPALLPAAILLSVPRREKPPPLPPPPAGPPVPTWWPTAWWPQWAAQRASQAAPPPGSPSGAGPPGPSTGPPGWAAPGSGGG